MMSLSCRAVVLRLFLLYLLTYGTLKAVYYYYYYYYYCTVFRPALVALLVASRYALPGYGDQRVWVRGTGWPDHCLTLRL